MQHSEIAPRPKEQKLSTLLWGLDWRQHLPLKLSDDGVHAHSSDLQTAWPFIEHHYPALFGLGQHSHFVEEPLSVAKIRYYELAGDFFELRHERTTIGLFIGTPIDWSSYYLRSGGVLEAYRGQRLLPTLFEFIIERLERVGVARVEGETAPANLPCVSMLNRLKFNVTGTSLSERWGALTRFTRFLSGSSTRVFLRQYCAGNWHPTGPLLPSTRE